MASAVTDWKSRIGRRVTLRDLYTLSAVVRWGSMAKAASHLSMSQSAVSESIAHLEEAVRVRLLDRTPQGIKPTVYAEALLKREHAVFDELLQGIKDIEFLADPTKGEVNIACPDFISAGLLPAAIDRFLARSENYIVQVLQLNLASFEFRELRDRKVDLALARVPTTFADEELNVEVLFDDPHYIVAGLASPWAKRRRIDLAELVNAPWVLPNAKVFEEGLFRAFKLQGLEAPSIAVSATSLPLRNQLLATGRFLSVQAISVLHRNAKEWSLKALPVNVSLSPPPVAVITLRNRTIRPVVQLFIEELRAVVKTIPGTEKARKT